MTDRDSLGNITEFASTFPRTYGEFLDAYGLTAMRFALQATARELLPNERVRICWRYPLPEAQSVKIIYSQERKRARTRGLMRCGSGWVCPVCALYITEKRRSELQRAVLGVRDTLFVVMATYTVRHNASDKLARLLANMQEAYRRMKSGRDWQTVKEEWFMAGSVRALEITHGDAGWHPHYHELIFGNVADLATYYAGDLKRYAFTLENQLRLYWMDALKKEGLSAAKEISVTVRAADDDVADYVAKYGKMPAQQSSKNLPSEIAGTIYKSGRAENRSVYEILFGAFVGNERDKRLFVEYASATKGRSQLQWSKGLKARLNIEEISDLLAAEGEATESDILLAELSPEQWRHIIDQGFAGQVMSIANTGRGEELRAFLERVVASAPLVVNVNDLLEEPYQ